MPLRITCPECRTAYSVADNLVGKKLRCRKCQALVPITASAPAPAPTPAVTSTAPKAEAPPSPPAPALEDEDIPTVEAVEDEDEEIIELEAVTAKKPAAPPAKRPAVAAGPLKAPRMRDEDDEEDKEDEEGPTAKPAKATDRKPKKRSATAIVAGGVVLCVFVLLGLIMAAVHFSRPEPQPEPIIPPPFVFGPGPMGPGMGEPGMPDFGGAEGKAGGLDLTNPRKPGTPVGPGPAQPPDAAQPGPVTVADKLSPAVPASATGPGQRLYNYVLQSTVFIINQPQNIPGFSFGSGSLIDRENRIILTNYHVIANGAQYTVFFPLYDSTGHVVPDREPYLKRLARNDPELLKAKLLAHDKTRDLALLQVDRLPPGVEPLRVADQSAQPGDTVHAVGNQGATGALWGYTSGTVRQVYRRKWIAAGPGLVFPVDAQVVITQAPTSQGDSGGPLVNDRGELVAVTQGINSQGQNVTLFIDQSEVHQFLKDYFANPKKEPTVGPTWVRASRPLYAGATPVAGTPPPTPPMPPSPTPTKMTVPDLVARLKGPDARQRAEAAQGLKALGTAARPAYLDLVRALKDNDEQVRRGAQEALAALGPVTKDDVRSLLLPALNDAGADVQLYALDQLGKLSPAPADALPEVVKAAEAKDAAVRTAALRLAVKWAGKERGKVTPALEKALKDGDKSVRIAAAELLTAKETLTTADVPRLQEMLKHGDVEVRGAAAAGLTQLGTGAKEALPALMETVKDETLPAATRLACLKAASSAGAGPKDFVPVLQKAVRDNNMELRIAALDAVARLGPNASATVGGVIKALDERESRKAALAALAALGPDVAKEGAPQALRFIDDAELRPDVLTTLTALKPSGPDAAPLVTKLIEIVGDETKADVRAKEVALLAAIGKPAVQPLALAVDRNPNQHVRQAAAEALGQMGGTAREAVPLLTKAARADSIKEVREAAAAAIVKIRK